MNFLQVSALIQSNLFFYLRAFEARIRNDSNQRKIQESNHHDRRFANKVFSLSNLLWNLESFLYSSSNMRFVVKYSKLHLNLTKCRTT